MKKDVSIIFRTTKDTKSKVNEILKRNNLGLSALLNAYMLDTIERDMVPINIRSKIRACNKNVITIPEIKKAVNEIIKEKYFNKIKQAYIFGSVARGENNEQSDVDISINTDKNIFRFFDLIEFQDELENKIGKEVDVVVKNECDKKFLDNIKEEEICIYGTL